jgi:hypothetical protein
MKFLKFFLSVILGAVPSIAQELPNLRDKPPAKFERNSFCAAEGLTENDHNDPELNKAKNRIDDAQRYFRVSFNVIQNLEKRATVT